MKRTMSLLVLLAAPLAAQGSFEGAMTVKVADSKGKESSIAYMMKDGKIRMNQPGPKGENMGIIIDGSTKKMLMLMDAQKMYMEMELKSPAEKKPAGDRRTTAERTGRMERIAGYNCEHVIVTDDDGTATDACVSGELGSFRMPMGGGPMTQPREPGWASGLGANAFPLRVQKGEKVVFEVTTVERKSLDAALFAPPSGFNKFEMPSMPSFKRPPR